MDPTKPVSPEPIAAEVPVAESTPTDSTTDQVPPAAPTEQSVNMATAPEKTAEEIAESTPATADQQAPAAEVAKLKPARDVDTKIAIIATVVIIIVLAGLATLAFLKQK